LSRNTSLKFNINTNPNPNANPIIVHNIRKKMNGTMKDTMRHLSKKL